MPRTTLIVITLALVSLCQAHERMPFKDALNDANVSLSSMKDGQRESLLFGNGDMYGIIWDKNGELFVRVTKNDIWDARVDTSKDGDMPRVDIANGKVHGPRGAPPSYKLPYPQPRCAAALKLGPTPGDMAGHLDLEKAAASIHAGDQPHSTLLVLYNRNVLLVRSL
ncbi:MAG: hypothetical protein MI741_13475, partial [Rhodospirillales bacterium]|nr:hypothetical protein [Rhodospirillales bacterium]